MVVRHPNLWVVIRHKKDEQLAIGRQIRQADRGLMNQQRKKKWRLLENRIQRLKTEYNNGLCNIESYWNAVSHLIHNF